MSICLNYSNSNAMKPHLISRCYPYDLYICRHIYFIVFINGLHVMYPKPRNANHKRAYKVFDIYLEVLYICTK